MNIHTMRYHLKKHGYHLHQGKDPLGMVGFYIVDSATNTVVAGDTNGNFSISWREVEEFIADCEDTEAR